VANERGHRFDEADVLADACHAAGAHDFGDDVFRTPLQVLLSSLADAPLNEMGVALLRGGIVKSLVTRLRAVQWFDRCPEIAAETIERPIVVVGMMRSGTTLLQRLLASDPRCYCAFGWEVNDPAPPLDMNWDEPDPRIMAAEARDEQMRTYAPDLYAIHPMDAHQAEEEIMFFADAFLSHVPEASCRVLAYRSWLDGQDFTPAYVHLQRMLQLLQWQKKRRGQYRSRWVLKTPAHLGYLETLFSVFPDAHVVHVHRDPLDTIPSGASLNTTLWKMHADDVDPAEVGRQWIERMAWANRRALAARERLERERVRFTDVWFRDAVADPLGQIERIYDATGLELHADARMAMTEWLASDAREPRPSHTYTARQFGLTDDQIREEFAGYIARYIADHEGA
jgi:Sulfotransferase family